jgi:sugar-specific transcriptional regulator TrmB
MDSDELVETMRGAGLSPYQAAAYVALLDLGAAPATDIADASDVPKPRVYDVLDALEERGFVECYETDTLHARAHDPGEVLSTLRDRAERFETAAEEVEDRWEKPELESNGASIVKQYDTVLKHAEEFIRAADHQIQLSTTMADFERLKPLLVDAHERGVVIRLSLHTEPDADRPSAARFEGACSEARHRELPAPFVALVDRRKTCFAHHPSSFDQYGVLVDDHTHTFVFHWYFLACLWEHWEPLYALRTDGVAPEYVDIRRCVGDLRPVLTAGGSVEVDVEGHDLRTGEDVRFAGRVVEALYAPEPPDGDPDGTLELGGQVTLIVETDRGEVSVGGWGAVVEDVEATRIAIRSVTPAESLESS